MMISVIVVTYNSASVIGSFLESLDDTARYLDLQVETLITDNASTDRTSEIVYNSYRRFSHLQIQFNINKRNVGLSRALNTMIDRCRGDRILMCNPDIVFTYSIMNMVDISKSHPEMILVPELVNLNGTIQRAIYRRFPTVARIVSDMTSIGPFLRIFRRINEDYKYHDSWLVSGKRDIARIEQGSAVCMFVPRNIAAQFVPFYDPAFPVFWNDVDMSMRAHKLGVPICIVPSARVFHEHAHSAKREDNERLYMLAYSSHGMMGYAKRWNLHPILLRMIFFIDAVFSVVRALMYRLRKGRWPWNRSIRELTRSYLLRFRCSLC